MNAIRSRGFSAARCDLISAWITASPIVSGCSGVRPNCLSHFEIWRATASRALASVLACSKLAIAASAISRPPTHTVFIREFWLRPCRRARNATNAAAIAARIAPPEIMSAEIAHIFIALASSNSFLNCANRVTTRSQLRQISINGATWALPQRNGEPGPV